MEFVACQEEGEGVLVLSELTGAARTLGDGALLVNPFAIQQTADALETALAMDVEERRRRMRQLFQRVSSCDVNAWLERILGEALRAGGGERESPGDGSTPADGDAAFDSVMVAGRTRHRRPGALH
jgi:trehalose-6-phosphate synthase